MGLSFEKVVRIASVDVIFFLGFELEFFNFFFGYIYLLGDLDGECGGLRYLIRTFGFLADNDKGMGRRPSSRWLWCCCSSGNVKWNFTMRLNSWRINLETEIYKLICMLFWAFCLVLSQVRRLAAEVRQLASARSITVMNGSEGHGNSLHIF